jgi:hypothetical protein
VGRLTPAASDVAAKSLARVFTRSRICLHAPSRENESQDEGDDRPDAGNGAYKDDLDGRPGDDLGLYDETFNWRKPKHDSTRNIERVQWSGFDY